MSTNKQHTLSMGMSSKRPQSTPAYTYTSTSLEKQSGSPLTHKRTSKKVNLVTFDDHSATSIEFNTPRSIEACKRLGIESSELVHRPLDTFIDQIDRSVLSSIPGYADKLYQHYENRRLNKIEQLRAIRKKLRVAAISNATHDADDYEVISVSSDATGSSSVVQAAQRKMVTALERERKAVMRMNDREMSKIKNKVLYELKCATLKAEQEERLHREREEELAMKQAHEQSIKQRAERDRRYRLEMKQRIEQEQLEKQKQAAVEWQIAQQHAQEQRELEERKRLQQRLDQEAAARRAAQKKHDLNTILQQQQQRIEEKAAELQKREEQRLHALQQQRALDAQYAQQQRQRKEHRFRTAYQNQQRMEDEKRTAYEEKERLMEERRQALEQQRLADAREAERRAKHKQQMIQNAQAEATRVLEAKKNAVLEQHRETRERLEAEERARAADESRQLKELHMKEQQRRQSYHQANKLLNDRITNVNERIAAAERRHAEMLEQQRQHAAAKKLHEALVQADRQELVRHTENVRKYKAEKLLAKIDADTERVMTMKNTMKLLQKQREMIRVNAQLKTKAIVSKFEDIAHKGKWDVVTSDNPKQNLLIRAGVLTGDDLRAVVARPKRAMSAGYISRRTSSEQKQLMPASPLSSQQRHVLTSHSQRPRQSLPLPPSQYDHDNSWMGDDAAHHYHGTGSVNGDAGKGYQNDENLSRQTAHASSYSAYSYNSNGMDGNNNKGPHTSAVTSQYPNHPCHPQHVNGNGIIDGSDAVQYHQLPEDHQQHQVKQEYPLGHDPNSFFITQNHQRRHENELDDLLDE